MSSVGTPACIMMLAAVELVFASVYAAQADFFLFADLTHSLDGGDILPYERTRADAFHGFLRSDRFYESVYICPCQP